MILNKAYFGQYLHFHAVSERSCDPLGFNGYSNVEKDHYRFSIIM